MLVIGILFWVVSTAGLCAAKKKSTLCLTIFTVGIVVLCLGFLGITFGAVYAESKLTKDVDSENACTNVMWVANLDTSVTKAFDIFGSDECWIYVEDASMFPADAFDGKSTTSSDIGLGHDQV